MTDFNSVIGYRACSSCCGSAIWFHGGEGLFSIGQVPRGGTTIPGGIAGVESAAISPVMLANFLQNNNRESGPPITRRL